MKINQNKIQVDKNKDIKRRKPLTQTVYFFDGSKHVNELNNKKESL